MSYNTQLSNAGQSKIYAEQGILYIENKLKKISNLFFGEGKEGFSGLLGPHAGMEQKNSSEKLETQSNVNALKNNLAQYSTATNTLKDKTTAYFNKTSTYSKNRNFNVFVNEVIDPEITSVSRCISNSTASLSTATLAEADQFAAAYPNNFASFADAKNACKTWAIDSGNQVFALTKGTTPNSYKCYTGTNDSYLNIAQYTKPEVAYNLTGATSTDATKGGLFSNGRVGVYAGNASAGTDACKITNMPAPYKQTRFDSPNNNPWYGSAYWGFNLIPDKTAYWIWPDNNAPNVMGYGKYMYYSYNNPKTSAITAFAYCVADNYADLILNGNVVFTNRGDAIPRQTITLLPGSNIFELRPGNAGGPGAVVFVVQGDVGNGIETLFKSGDPGWGVAAARCTYEQMAASNPGTGNVGNPANIKYFTGYDFTKDELKPYQKCDPMNGGDIYQPSISASFGRNCSNIAGEPLSARYVRVKNRPDREAAYGGGSYMQIAQLVVLGYDNGQLKNLAANGRPGNSVGGSVTAKSDGERIWGAGNGAVLNAINGNESSSNNIYHSAGNGPDEFWLLDLGKTYPITKITYYNRGDCCQNRAIGMTIELWNSPPTDSGTPLQKMTLNAGLKQEFNIRKSGPQVNCDGYGDNDTNLPNECNAEIWKESGCTTDSVAIAGGNAWWAQRTKRAVKTDMNLWATMPDHVRRVGCYGTDKTKWPALIPKYKEVFGNNGTVSCDRYCAGSGGRSWNNELPGWGGANCAAQGTNNEEPCSLVKGSLTKCICERNDARGWAQ